MPDEQRITLQLKYNIPGQGVLLTTLMLLAVGAVMVPSSLATVTAPPPLYARASFRHIVFAVLAAMVLFTAWRFDYRRLFRGQRFAVIPATLLIVALVCGILVLIPSVGRAVGGYRRWIRIGPPQYAIGFQPSELIKLALVIFLSAWLCRPRSDVGSFRRTFLPAVALVGICVAVVITQDFGTAVVIALTAAVTMLLAGIRWYWVGSLAVWAGVLIFVLLVSSPRRWARIEAMLNPTAIENPSTYQLRQSLTAIRSGGYTGKGLGMGMMKHGFLPEDSTDFIFAILCEEWGLIGAAMLIAILLGWLIFAGSAAGRCGDKFGQVLAGSLGFLIGLQAFMHIAVNTGCLPPTGIAMPFVSAGGTSLVLMAAAAAMIVSVSSRPAADYLR